MKRITLLCFLILTLNAYDYNFFFQKVGNYFNIEPLIIKTIAIEESGISPNKINVNIKHNNSYYKLINFLKKHNIAYKQHKKQMVSFSINKKNYIAILNFLNSNRYSFDIGLMQINNFHAKTFFMQKLLLQNPFYNIYMGSKILRECFDKSKDAYQTISCYNSGSPYKIRKTYLKNFFEIFKKIKKS